LSSKNVNKNTGLFHLAGIELAPSAQSETLSKSLEVLFLGSNLFFRERWFDKRQERQCVKAFCVRLQATEPSLAKATISANASRLGPSFCAVAP
jgi:hypothetical protein